ncbi:MAG: alkaline phosphatase [Bacteroidia bacterium]|nr:alkaline phosphatase [Bacteroidia bacterium]
MKAWKKTSLLTTAILIVLLFAFIYLFKVNLSFTSSDIEFTPNTITNEIPSYQGEHPKNIIIFIVDGMGFGHLSLAIQTQRPENSPTNWEDFDVRGWHDPRSIYGSITDSEASATAMATGVSTNFGHIGIDKEGKVLTNLFEEASALNYSTGIVTDSYIWDGTPAAFVAHTRNEDDARDILTQIASSELDLIFGELEDVGEDDVPEVDESIAILKKRFFLLGKDLKLPDGNKYNQPVAVIFEEDEIQDLNSTPNLPKLTEVALKYMGAQNKPFALLVECEELDSASHENDSERVINGLKSIQETLALVLDFAKTNGETLVVFTSDHETGGLAAASDFGNYPNLQIRWSTKSHTAAVVPLFAVGPGAQNFVNVQRNYEIGQLLKSLLVQEKIDTD